MLSFRLFSAEILFLMLIMGAQLVVSHTWLEYVQVEGKKAMGYIRGYNGRNEGVDRQNSYLMGSKTALVCKDTQRSPINSASFPRLDAAPGDRVVAFHTENGHVSLLPNSQARSGPTYWFGTTDQQVKVTLGDVLNWKDAGTQQGGPGVYLSSSTYDDGKCAEPNNSPISAQRGVGPTGVGKLCKDSGFEVPEGLKPGSIYTVYWVWDFSEHFGPNPNSFEWYSSCLDINIVAPAADSQKNNTSSRPCQMDYGPAEAF